MSDPDKIIRQKLTAEHDAIEALYASAAADPAALEMLQRQHGTRLGHLKDRLAAVVPASPISKEVQK